MIAETRKPLMAQQNLIDKLEQTIDAIDLTPTEKAYQAVDQLIRFLGLEADDSPSFQSHWARIIRTDRRLTASKLRTEVSQHRARRQGA